MPRSSSQIRLVLIAGGSVLLLGVAALVLALNPISEALEEVSFKAVEPVDVVQLIISNAYGTIDIGFTGEGYVVDDIPAELVDFRELLDLLAVSGTVFARRTVTDAPDDLAAYGLDEPAAQVEITYADGTSLSLHIGDVERVTGDTYVSVGDDPTVYLMASRRCAGYLLPKKAYVEDLVTPELARSSPLSAILDVTFTGGRLVEPVKVVAVAEENPEAEVASLSFGAATHIVRAKGVYELDQTYGVEMLGPLLGITAQDVVGYLFTPEEIADFGFDQPTMTVEFDLKNGLDAEIEHYLLTFLLKDGVCYVIGNAPGVIYAIEEPPFLQIETKKLLLRWFLSPLLIDVGSVEVALGDETYVFAISGESAAEKQVTLNGIAYDIARFRTFYRLLTSAAHDDRLLDGIVVDGAPLLQVTYHYLDERKQPDVMTLYPGDARRLYVSINGVTELAMRETYLDRVQEALVSLWTDAPIEIEW